MAEEGGARKQKPLTFAGKFEQFDCLNWEKLDLLTIFDE